MATLPFAGAFSFGSAERPLNLKTNMNPGPGSYITTKK